MSLKEFVALLGEHRDMTQAELARTLGYKSRTSLTRLCAGHASDRALRRFADSTERNLTLSIAERQLLEEIRDQAVWREDYEAKREMERFFLRLGNEEAQMTLVRMRTGERLSLDTYLSGMTKPVLWLRNSTDACIYPQLGWACRERNARIVHEIKPPLRALPIIRMIRRLRPVVYEQNYTCLELTAGSRPMFTAGLLRADLMLAEYADAEGARHCDLVIFEDPRFGCIVDGENLRAVLEAESRAVNSVPIKRAFHASSPAQTFIEYMQYCCELETAPEILRIKPDICMEWIPADIAGMALMEGPGADVAGDEEAAARLLRIQNRRYRQSFDGTRTSVSLMKRSALRQFAMTGRTMDHLFAMRPYTPAERVRILRRIERACQEQEGFSIRFLREDNRLADMGMTLFEGIGLLIYDGHTDYRLGDRHAEVLLTHAGFMRLCREYMEQELLREAALPEAETLLFLHALIEETEKLAEKEEAESQGSYTLAAKLAGWLEEDV